jgi:FixJ family two-component response regulator
MGGPTERSRAALSQEADTQAIGEGYASLSRRDREVMALVVGGPVEAHRSTKPRQSQLLGGAFGN